MRIYRGDTAPNLVVTCKDGDTVVNLTTAASIRVIGKMENTVVVDSTSVTNGGTAGTVTYEWAAADTDTAGRMFVEVEVTWGGGTVQTFRCEGYVDILPDYA